MPSEKCAVGEVEKERREREEEGEKGGAQRQAIHLAVAYTHQPDSFLSDFPDTSISSYMIPLHKESVTLTMIDLLAIWPPGLCSIQWPALSHRVSCCNMR